MQTVIDNCLHPVSAPTEGSWPDNFNLLVDVGWTCSMNALDRSLAGEVEHV